jgi:hypothetical protein
MLAPFRLRRDGIQRKKFDDSWATLATDICGHASLPLRTQGKVPEGRKGARPDDLKKASRNLLPAKTAKV